MRYLVYREQLVGSVEAYNWSQASGSAFFQFGDRVIRVSPAAGAPSEERVDRERAATATWREKHPNNDVDQDGG